MAKDPAFLFYPNDWIGGTLGMTFEEKGAYMELLMTQFNRGHMSGHMIGQVVGQSWDKIKDKFVKDEKGLWYNTRLEEEKMKRQKFTKSRNNNSSGKNQHTKNKNKIDEKEGGHMTNHMTGHMEDEDYNTINNKIKEQKEISNGTWIDEKKYFQNDQNYQLGICTTYKLKKEEVDSYIKEFLDMLELNQDYKSCKELRRHFTNWVKKKITAALPKQYNQPKPFDPGIKLIIK